MHTIEILYIIRELPVKRAKKCYDAAGVFFNCWVPF